MGLWLQVSSVRVNSRRQFKPISRHFQNLRLREGEVWWGGRGRGGEADSENQVTVVFTHWRAACVVRPIVMCRDHMKLSVIQPSRCHLSEYIQQLGPHQAQATLMPAVWCSRCSVRAIVHHVILGRLSLPIKPIMGRLCPYWEG
jgi:hypothetical protein